MSFKDTYPDYADIEAHVKRARIERSLALSQAFADAAEAFTRGLRRVAKAFSSQPHAENDRRFVESDTFLKRWVSHH